MVLYFQTFIIISAASPKLYEFILNCFYIYTRSIADVVKERYSERAAALPQYESFQYINQHGEQVRNLFFYNTENTCGIYFTNARSEDQLFYDESLYKIWLPDSVRSNLY